MARIRSIKPEFWKSETIAALPWRTRLTFIGLWSYVDDNGVGIDSFKLIAAELFGLDDDPREVRDNTRESLASLADAGLITRYTLGGKRYFRVTNWDEHQRIDRPGKARYPLPDDEAVTLLDPTQAAEMDLGAPPPVAESRESRDTLATVHRLEKGRRGEGEQGRRGEEEKEGLFAPLTSTVIEPKPKTFTPRQIAEHFARLWDAYPRKAAKGEAEKAFAKAVKEGTDPELIIAGAIAYRDHGPRQRAEIKFTKHPATWLNQKCWLDDLTAEATERISANGHQPYRNPTAADAYHQEL